MIKYFLKRIFASLITLLAVVTLTFFLVHAIPGGPFTSEKKLPLSVQMNLEKKYGLDKPLGTQYVVYLENLAKGDLGFSTYNEGRTVNEIITYSFPTSAKLGLLAVLFALIVGIYLGVLAALHQGKWQDSLSMVLATVGVTIPSFVLATLLIYAFAVKLQLLPAVGFDGPKNYILPVIALGIFPMAFITRYSRSMLVDVLKQDYVRTAKAKGLSRVVVTYKHALKNSLVPIITYLGPLVAGVLTGSFVIESIFGIPGLGREFVTCISNRDYPEVLGVTVFYAALLIACNFIVDMLYAVADPRIRLDK